MTHGNHYLGKLYNDLIANSPQTISMDIPSDMGQQLSNSEVIVFVVSHDFEFIVRTCTEVVQLDDHGAIQNHRLSPEILKTLSEKYFT